MVDAGSPFGINAVTEAYLSGKCVELKHHVQHFGLGQFFYVFLLGKQWSASRLFKLMKTNERTKTKSYKYVLKKQQ